MNRPISIAAIPLLILLAGPALTDDDNARTISFLDASAPVCDVADALGPDGPRDCGAEETALCVRLGVNDRLYGAIPGSA